MVAAEQNLQAWRALGLEARLADDARCRRDFALAAERLSLPGALQLYDAAPTPVLRADLWRLAVVLLEGGIYADADVQPLSRLRSMLAAASSRPASDSHGPPHRSGPKEIGLILFIENWSFIPDSLGRAAIALGLTDFARFPQYRNCIFAAAAPAHPLLESALRLALERLSAELARREGDGQPERTPADARVLELTGPGLLTDAARAFLAERGPADVLFIDRGTGTSLFIHAGVGSWKQGSVKSGYTERLLVLAAFALGVCALVCALTCARRAKRSRGRDHHSME